MFNILHIEKSKFFVQSFRTILEELGHNVYCAADVDVGFEVLKKVKIHFIVTALSGNETLFERLHDSEYEDISILVLTSTDDIQTRQKLFNLGISDYIIKNQITPGRLQAYFDSFNKSHGFNLKGRELEIAVLDDSYLSLKVIRKIFSRSTFTNISYFSRASDLLESKKEFTIYLIDLILPETTGEEVMLKIRKENPYSVIILISSVTNYKTISNILLLGADDFLMKPFDRSFFIARISSHLRTYYLREDLKEKNEILERMAYTDGLTGLYNHKFIIGRLKEEYERALRYEHPLSVAMIDIDFFKRVNDEYGHPVGDEVLIEVSKILKSCIRQSDVIGRYGGEEFLVIFPECNREQALHAAVHMKNTIEKNKFSIINHTLTISGGICEYDGRSLSSIISTADKNLYKAKNSGRNKICI